MSNRIAALASKLQRVTDAKALTSTDVWDAMWKDCEQELTDRLFALGPEDDLPRYRLVESIKALKQLRRVFENGATGEKALLQELDILEGRKTAPIA